MGKMTQGWIPIDRQIQDHWLWNDKPFSKGQAWIDLIMLANHEDKKMPYKGEIIVCERGTVNRSMLFLSERWGWSRKKVKSFLTLLESDGMVTTRVTTNRTVITIENYTLYNDTPTTRVATKAQQKHNEGNNEGTTREQRGNINNNDNNENNDNKNNNNVHSTAKEVDDLFEALWSLYPVKKGKGQISATKKRTLFDIGFDEMERAIQRYKDELKKDSSWRKPQNGSTFFNHGYIDYLDANFKPQTVWTGQQNNTATMLNESYDMMDTWAQSTKGVD